MAGAEEFDEFVAARSQALLRTAFLLTADWALAEDLLQVALTKCWRSWRRIDRSPEAYVRRTLVTTYSTWWRRRWRSEQPSAAVPEVAGQDEIAGVDSRDEVWRLVGTLPARQRAVVVLRFYEDMSEAEIAEVLGCSVGTVKSQCSRALAKLRGVVDHLGVCDG